MEQWTRWEPIPNLAPMYYIKSVYDDINGLKIILSEYKNIHNELHITFKNSVDFFVKTDETFISSIMNDLYEKHNTKSYTEWSFFKVTNSRHIKMLSKQSYGVADSRDFMHFSFISIDSLLEVVADYEPTFEFKKEI